jgi:hypothetical protein
MAEKFCILGAGSSGLAVANNFRQLGIPFDCLEREDELGGNWCFGKPASSVHRSTRLISSKPLTEFVDFPMPEDYPDQPGQALVWQYLRDYAEHFDLYSSIEFGIAVRWIEPAPGSGWIVTLSSGERRRYRGVVIANGHNWDPRWPVFRGRFSGTLLHSSEYKSPEPLVGRRVLVVGGGNSGFDIACESAKHAAATFHSLRRRYHVLPRFYRGQPIDACGEWMLNWRVPLWLKRLSAARVRAAVWGFRGRGQGRADHRLFETHPVINSDWPGHVDGGEIVVKPNVQELRGKSVLFDDGSQEEIDVIVCATGFCTAFPFLPVERLNWHRGRPDLYLNLFHPGRDDLFVVGLIQPDSGQFGLVDYQSRLLAEYIVGLDQSRPAARRLQALKRTGRMPQSHRIRYVDSPRHLLEVEHHSYRRELTQWIERLAAT